ncbi:MAG: hypothetical protein NC917_07075 [Candidatus Omnitrophica bacterium]|nr:hypothetical protein [Candidatus Omnitrophota bacterium]MCM8811386.1 hypothetical protein [Candidatus Omnitrophota bacterium]
MGKILIVTKEKEILEKFLNCATGYGYDCEGFLWTKVEVLIKLLNKFNNLEILVLEITEPNFEVKKFLKILKDKFKDCKTLLLLTKIDRTIEDFILEYSIDAYLTFPILPSQFLRSLYILKQS